MSIPFLQHSIQPTNSRAEYEEFNTLDFVVTAEGRRVMGNSFRLVGNIRVLENTADPTTLVDASKDISLDGSIGIHSVIENIQTSITGAGGVVENMGGGYARYVGMVADATTCENDSFNSEMSAELRNPISNQMKQILHGEISGWNTATLNDPCSFSMKPSFVLNATSSADGSGDLSMSYQKTGPIRIQVTLARNFACLFGKDVSSSTGYKLTNVRLEFMSIPENGANTKTAHRVKYHIRQSVLSSFTNVSAKIPAICNAVSCSFKKQSEENQAEYNHNERETLPNLSNLQFLFNNNTNELVQYNITSRPEVLHRYLESFMDADKNRVSLKKLKGNSGYGIGLDFQEYTSLANQTFNVQLSSGVSSASPYSAHLYFHSLVEL